MRPPADYSPNDPSSGHVALASFDFDDLIERGLNVSFLISVLYRRGPTLPPEFSGVLDASVVHHAKRAAAWDSPGGDHFPPNIRSWLNRQRIEKRWMFYVHSGVYLANGLEFSGVVKDYVASKYERARPSQRDPAYTHILDASILSAGQAFSKATGSYELVAMNVRNDLLSNLARLQMEQSQIISRYLGETEGNIQPDVLSDAVKIGMASCKNLHQLEVIDWLPGTILVAMDQMTEMHRGNVGRNDFYFGATPDERAEMKEAYIQTMTPGVA
jgi:hypothetical protein